MNGDTAIVCIVTAVLAFMTLGAWIDHAYAPEPECVAQTTAARTEGMATGLAIGIATSR